MLSSNVKFYILYNECSRSICLPGKQAKAFLLPVISVRDMLRKALEQIPKYQRHVRNIPSNPALPSEENPSENSSIARSKQEGSVGIYSTAR